MHALSLHTWVIHISSVVEWVVSMVLVWTYGRTLGSRAWQAFAVAMAPVLGGALCACTWHFFDNSPRLEWLVSLQATLTLLGNTTLMGAAYWLYSTSPQRAERPQRSPSEGVEESPRPG